jgi:hypothetical protein
VRLGDTETVEQLSLFDEQEPRKTVASGSPVVRDAQSYE